MNKEEKLKHLTIAVYSLHVSSNRHALASIRDAIVCGIKMNEAMSYFTNDADYSYWRANFTGVGKSKAKQCQQIASKYGDKEIPEGVSSISLLVELARAPDDVREEFEKKLASGEFTSSRDVRAAKRKLKEQIATPVMSKEEEDAYLAFKVAMKEINRLARGLGKEELHWDHYVPLSKGGENSIYNVEILRASNNLSKGSKLPEGMK